MKITAKGWSRSVVGNHTIIETGSRDVQLNTDGTVTITGKSKHLELSGHFRLNIEFTAEDIHALATLSARAPLEKKINELMDEIHDLKNNLTVSDGV